jgi:nicotinamide-nucleotide amidase
MTGGLLAARLTAVEGSAEPFAGGYVAEAVATNVALLGVPEALIREHGLASAPVAEALAESARRSLDADYGLSITGLAGVDGGTAEKPAGTVFIGLASRHGVASRRQQFLGKRDEVRHRATHVALDWLRRELLGVG